VLQKVYLFWRLNLMILGKKERDLLVKSEFIQLTKYDIWEFSILVIYMWKFVEGQPDSMWLLRIKKGEKIYLLKEG